MITPFYIISDFILLISRILFSLFIFWYYLKVFKDKNFLHFIYAISVFLGWLIQLVGFIYLIYLIFCIVKSIKKKNFDYFKFLIFIITLIYVFNGPGLLSIDYIFKIRIY
jgi:hypothetical protein